MLSAPHLCRERLMSSRVVRASSVGLHLWGWPPPFAPAMSPGSLSVPAAPGQGKPSIAPATLVPPCRTCDGHPLLVTCAPADPLAPPAALPGPQGIAPAMPSAPWSLGPLQAPWSGTPGLRACDAYSCRWPSRGLDPQNRFNRGSLPNGPPGGFLRSPELPRGSPERRLASYGPQGPPACPRASPPCVAHGTPLYRGQVL